MERYLEDQSRALTVREEDNDQQERVKQPPTPEALDQFKAHLKEWIATDVHLKNLQKEMAPIRKRKGVLTAMITEFMHHFNIEDVNTRDCRVRYSVRQTRAPVSNNAIRSKLYERFNEDDVNDVFDCITKAQPVQQKPSLRRITIT